MIGKSHGYTLVEVIIAMGIIAIAIGLFGNIFGVASNAYNTNSRDKLASSIAESLIEELNYEFEYYSSTNTGSNDLNLLGASTSTNSLNYFQGFQICYDASGYESFTSCFYSLSIAPRANYSPLPNDPLTLIPYILTASWNDTGQCQPTQTCTRNLQWVLWR